jgi:hypothetical protein
MKLTAYLHLNASLGMNTAIPPLPPLFLLYVTSLQVNMLGLPFYLRHWRWDKQVIPKRWSYTKNWRRAITQKILSNISTKAEASKYVSCLTFCSQ